MADPSITSNGAAASADTGAKQLPINLFTLHAPDSIPSSTYLLPADWRRFQLSELINKVLKNGTPDGEAAPVPFEFVVEGQVLRGSLDAWVRANRAGDSERVIDVEYRRSLRAPEEKGRVEVPDWVSGLSLQMPGYILVSSYLSHLQLLPISSPTNPITLPLPNLLGATCGTYLNYPSPSSSSSPSDGVRLAAGGVDSKVHIFDIPSLSSLSSHPPREVYTLHGHSAPITSIITGREGQDVVSASWDGHINLYVLLPGGVGAVDDEHYVEAEPTSYLPGQKKRRRLNKEKGEDAAQVEGLTDGDVGQAGWRRNPDNTLTGHKGRIGGMVWDKNSKDRVWSAGWDGSVRGWDLGGVESTVKQGPMDRSMLCIDQFSATGTLATGAMDRTICLWDTREATSLTSLTLRTTSPVPSLTCHPTSSFTLAAATYSGQVQIWDVRSPKHALFSVQRAGAGASQNGTNGSKREVTKNGKVLGERLLAIDWDGERLVAGGEDGEVGIWAARGE